MQVNYEELTVGNVAAGELARQFAAETEGLVEAFHDPESYEVRDGRIVGKVAMEVTFSFDPVTGQVYVVSGARATLPKRRSAGSFALLKGGHLYVAPEEPRQEALPFPRPVNDD